MRSVFMMAGLMVCAASMANITGDFMGMSAEALVKELAKQSGQDLRASATVQSEVLFMSVHDKPLEDVKARLANAMGAEWKKEGDTWFLTRSGVLAQQQKNKEIADRAERLRAELAKQIEAQAKLAAFDATEANRLAQEFQTAIEAARNGRDPNNWRRVMGLADQLPGTRAIITLLARMDMKSLAAIPAGARLVFSTNPTQMQTALPSGTVQLAQKMSADQEIMNQFGGSRGGMMGPFGRPQGDGALPTGPATRAMLVATRFGNGEGINLNFAAINADGKAITTSNFSLGESRERFFEDEQAESDKTDTESKPVTLRPESKELLSLLQQSLGRGGGNFMVSGDGGESVMVARTVIAGSPEGTKNTPAKLSDSLRAKIMRPDVYDPMSFFVADALKSVSSGHGRDIVAVLPDEVFQNLVTPLSGKEPRTKAVLDALRSSELLVDDAEGWLTIVPRAPVTARESVDREAFSKLLAAIDRSPVVRLDDLANYYATAPAHGGFGFLSFESGYPNIIGGRGAFDGVMDMFGGGRDGLRFYGRLTGNQRNTLKNGGRLSLGSLSPDQREYDFQTIFWSMDGPRLARPQQPGRMQELTVAFGGGGFSMFGGMDPASERTNILASGLPGGGMISMRGRPEQAVLVKEPGSGPSAKSLMQLAAERSGAFEMDGGGASKEALYQLMSQTNYTLTFNLIPNYTLSRSLKDPQMDPNGKYFLWEQLPVAFRNEIAKMAESFAREERAASQSARGGGTRQP